MATSSILLSNGFAAIGFLTHSFVCLTILSASSTSIFFNTCDIFLFGDSNFQPISHSQLKKALTHIFAAYCHQEDSCCSTISSNACSVIHSAALSAAHLLNHFTQAGAFHIHILEAISAHFNAHFTAHSQAKNIANSHSALLNLYARLSVSAHIHSQEKSFVVSI